MIPQTCHKEAQLLEPQVPKALIVYPEVRWGQAVNSFAFPDLQLPSRTLNFLVSSHLVCVKGASAPSLVELRMAEAPARTLLSDITRSTSFHVER